MYLPPISRREALKKLSAGFGYLAFAGLAAAQQPGPTLATRSPHFPAKAKRVIFLCMRGGPSHLDTFDHKPQLTKDDGRASRRASMPLFGSPWAFRQHGASGLWISELFPQLARHADDLCLLRGMHCDQPAHAQAYVQMHTGSFRATRPSMGAWALHGLGAANQDLPGFISINPPSANGGAQNYGSAFLPGVCQGTRFTLPDSSQRNRPVDRLRRGEPNPAGIGNAAPLLSASAQRAQIDVIAALDREKLSRDGRNPIVEAAIEDYALAFRMQAAMPAVMDLSKETPATLALYGIDEQPTDGFGRQCLLARRFAEAGVRFIELGHGSWDQHSNLRNALGENCAKTDKPIAGLIADLKQRGLLKDTLIIWGGEFGRSPFSPDGNGRDHNHKGFTMWMAGGGVRGGFSHGETDEHGYEAVNGRMHISDWHATVLHLLGLDHERLTFRHGGRDVRLTDLRGRVAREIIT